MSAAELDFDDEPRHGRLTGYLPAGRPTREQAKVTLHAVGPVDVSSWANDRPVSR